MTRKEKKRQELKAELNKQLQRRNHYQQAFDSAQNLHERDVAYIMRRCARNKIADLEEQLACVV